MTQAETEREPDDDVGEVDPSVKENTVKHWCLYVLDAMEAEDQAPEPYDEYTPREIGITADDIYHYAGGEDSIVFTHFNEISTKLSEMARETDKPPLIERHAEGTSWEGPDVIYRYRLTDTGRTANRLLGRPEKLPNRKDFTEQERELSVKPRHKPSEDQSDEEPSPLMGFWNPWTERVSVSGTDRVFYLSHHDVQTDENVGLVEFCKRLTEVSDFQDLTFVLGLDDGLPFKIGFDLVNDETVFIHADIGIVENNTPEDLRELFTEVAHKIRRARDQETMRYGLF